MRPAFADPKTDVIFKKIFGQPAHKDLLGIEMSAEQRAHMARLDLAALGALRQQIKAQRTWSG